MIALALLLVVQAAAPSQSPSPFPSATATAKPGPGYLALSPSDRKRERTKVMVWESFLAKGRCNQAIKNAKEEEHQPAPQVSCIGDACYETRCYGNNCYTEEQGESTKGLKSCQEGRINLPVGTYVKIEKEPEECGDSMVRVVLTGEWKGSTGCVETDNVTDKRP